jgi:hypothetical protein
MVKAKIKLDLSRNWKILSLKKVNPILRFHYYFFDFDEFEGHRKLY